MTADATVIPMERTLIYEGQTHQWRWHEDMLTAIASAKSLGVPTFEIDVRSDSRDVPVVETAGKDWMGMQAYQTTGSRPEPFKHIRVYAMRVGVSDDR